MPARARGGATGAVAGLQRALRAGAVAVPPGVVAGVGRTAGSRAAQRLATGGAPVQRSLPTLRVGSSGPAVRDLQGRLIARGAAIAADGAFGPKTRAAVIAHQASAGLAADGVVGPKTWAALSAGALAPATASGGASGVVAAKLREVQVLVAGLAQRAGVPTPAPAPPAPLAVQHDEQGGGWLDGISELASDVVDAVGGAASDVVDGVVGAAEGVAGAVSDAWDGVQEQVGDVVDDVGAAVGGAVDAAVDVAGDAVGGAVAVATDVAASVGEAVSGVVDAVSTTVDQVAGALGEAFGDELSAVREVLGRVGELLADPAALIAELDALLGRLRAKAKELLGEGGADGGDVRSGTVPDVEVAAAGTQCHDSQAAPAPRPLRPGHQRLRVAASLAEAGGQGVGEQPDAAQRWSDGVAATVAFEGAQSKNDDDVVQVPSTDFGTTGAKISVEKNGWVAERGTSVVKLDARHRRYSSRAITTTPGRIDVPKDLSTITKDNWRDAADDLDPTLHRTELGAPRRARFWASDLTEEHEKFHQDDGDRHSREVVTPALAAHLSRQTIDVPWLLWREAEVNKQVHALVVGASKLAKSLSDGHMNPPGGETRAYAADAPKYEARAEHIRALAHREGWWTKPRRTRGR